MWPFMLLNGALLRRKRLSIVSEKNGARDYPAPRYFSRAINQWCGTGGGGGGAAGFGALTVTVGFGALTVTVGFGAAGAGVTGFGATGVTTACFGGCAGCPVFMWCSGVSILGVPAAGAAGAVGLACATGCSSLCSGIPTMGFSGTGTFGASWPIP